MNRSFIYSLIFSGLFVWNVFALESPDIYVGPFSHWLNVKNPPYNATGNGSTNDAPAIQAAFNALKTGVNPVYFPAGTYKINSTISLQGCRGKSIIGAHPDSVKIIWGGSADGDMVVFDGVGSSRMMRITLDGASSTAYHGVVITIRDRNAETQFPTGLQFQDMKFLGFKRAILGGEGGNAPAAETVYDRCYFKSCNEGLFTADYNTADQWFKDCIFEDCGSSISGIGQGSVLNCIFRRSTRFDIDNIYYWSARHCFSTGSACFYRSSDGLDGKPGIVEGNTIIDPTSSKAMVLTGAGPFVVFDNVVRSLSTATAPVISRGSNLDGNFYIGNTFTVGTAATAIQPYNAPVKTGRVLDNTIVDRSTISATEPVLPSTPRRFTGNVYEPTALTSAAIQQAIIAAATANPTTLSVVYLRPGIYSISSTILIPKNIPICIMGETPGWGGSVRLNWISNGAGPVFKLQGPSKATLSGLWISGGTAAAKIISVENADQSGGRIYFNSLWGAENVTGIDCLVDRLDSTVVEGISFGLPGQDVGQMSGCKVIGGPLTAAGHATPGRTNLWNAGGLMAESELGTPYFDVTNNGRLMATDFWGESGAHGQPLVKLTSANSGTLTLQGFKMQYHGVIATFPNFLFDGFSGKASILGLSMYNGKVQISGSNANQNVLHAGNLFGAQGDWSSFASVTATQGQAAILNCTQSFDGTDLRNGGDIAACNVPDNVRPWGCYPHTFSYIHPVGNPTDAWIRDMMAQARTNHPMVDLAPTPNNVTDLKLYRVIFTQTSGMMKFSKCDTCGVGVVPSYTLSNQTANALRIFKTVMPGTHMVLPITTKRITVYDVLGKRLLELNIEHSSELIRAQKILGSTYSHTVRLIKIDQ